MTADNFLAVLAGAEPAVIGTSGKVIKSGPDDRVFVFYADHGAPGAFLHLQTLCQALYFTIAANTAAQFIAALACHDYSPLKTRLVPCSLTVWQTFHSWGTVCMPCLLQSALWGSAGIVGMPTGPFLYADQLIDVLHSKAENRCASAHAAAY